MTEPDRQTLRLLLAARLSRKVGKYQGIGIETQDQYGREWAERQHDFKTVHGTYLNVEVIDVAADVRSGRVPPWRRPNLKPWVTQPDKMQQYDGILAYKNDRLSRGDWDDETEIRQWASRHGKVLVIVDGPQWPPRDDGDFWAWTAQAKQAEKEWKEIRERSMRGQGELRERGKLVGSVPWGYDIVGSRYDKAMVPNDIGRKYILAIFQRIADGQSLSTVAAWLNSEGIKYRAWSPKTVSQIIHNRTYMGDRQNKGVTILRVPAFVDAKLWQDANNRLANAPIGRRLPVTGKPALLSGVLCCPHCLKDGKHAPMYRIKAWSGYFYRCAGHYPERKGCGNMVPLAITDAAVTALLSMAHEPWTELRPVPGENHDVEIADIKLAMRDLGAQDLPDNEYDAELRRLRAERDRLAALPNIPDQWKDVEFCATCGGSVWQDACEAAEHSKITIGQHFKGLDPDGQRAMLLENVKLYAELGPSDPELSKLAGKPYRVPILRMESRLFRMPVEWIGPSEPQTV